MPKGFDAPCDVSNAIPQIKAKGYDFVARYFSYNQAKNLSASEAKKLTDAGIAIVSVFEARGDQYSNFTAAQGVKDAAQSLMLAEQVGQPQGTVIYAAVDFDATLWQVSVGIADYFKGFHAGLNSKYKVGVYGSGMVCQWLKVSGLVEYCWLACAGGWQGTKTFTDWHIKQGLPANVGLGFQVDPNDAIDGDYGGWMVGGAEAAVQVMSAPALPPQQDITATIRDLQTELAALGLYKGTVDGLPGPQTQRALASYYNS